MKREIVEQEDLEESVEVVIAGYARKNAVISPKEKRIVAYHEIGHALVAAKQTESAPVHKITIVPRTSGALGYTMQVDESEHYLMTKEEAENKIATLTGGRAAEESRLWHDYHRRQQRHRAGDAHGARDGRAFRHERCLRHGRAGVPDSNPYLSAGRRHDLLFGHGGARGRGSHRHCRACASACAKQILQGERRRTLHTARGASYWSARRSPAKSSCGY